MKKYVKPEIEKVVLIHRLQLLSQSLLLQVNDDDIEEIITPEISL